MVLLRQAGKHRVAGWSPQRGTPLRGSLNQLNWGWGIQTGNTNLKTFGELLVI